MSGEAFRISKKAIDKIEKLSLSTEIVNLLRRHEGRMSSSRDGFEIFLRTKFKNIQEKDIKIILRACDDKWNFKIFNQLDFGDVHVLDKDLRIRRVPGGWNYEYLSEKGLVNCCCFVSTNELKTV